MDAIVLFAHGARDPEWPKPVRAVAQLLRLQFPDKLVEVAFLEFIHPTLPEAIQKMFSDKAGIDSVTIVPFFIAQGSHLRTELPEIVDKLRADHPEKQFMLLPPIGESTEMQQSMAQVISSFFF